MAQTHPNDIELLEYAEGDLDGSAAETIRLHVETCAACSTALEALGGARQVLRAAPLLELRPDRLEAMLASLPPQEQVARERRLGLRRLLTVLTPVAAVVALVVVLTQVDIGSETRDAAAPAPAEPAPAPAEPAPAEPAPAEPAPAPTGDPIVIGFVGAETGFMSVYDKQVFVGAQVAAKEINDAGGLLGRPVEFVTCDSKTDQAQASVCAEEVISKGAAFVMPSCDFDFGSPAARVAGDAGIVAIGCAGGLEYGVQGVGPLLFNTYSGSATEGAIMAEWAYNEKGWRKPYILTDNFLEYTKDVSEYFEKRWTEIGGADSIVGKDAFQNADESIAAQISRLRGAAKDADFIVVSSLPPGGAGAIRQIRAAGIDLPILAAAAFDGNYWLEAIPDLSEFYYPALGSLWGDDPDTARAKLLYEDFKALSGEDPTLASYPLMGYAAVQSLGKAVTTAGDTAGEAVATAMETFAEEPLITGPTTYTDACHIPSGRPYLMLQIQGGKNSYTGTTWTPESVPEHPC